MIEELLKKYPLKSSMISEKQLKALLLELINTIENNIEGDIVELGCFMGTTSVYLKRVLESYKTNKNLHVYDSFEGLPEKSEFDNSPPEYHKSALAVTERRLIENFKEKNVSLPIIHKGWFKNMDYPEKISFAFIDGDFYQSILDALIKVFPRMSRGGIMCIHDYDYPKLPGVKRACLDFFGKLDMIEKIGDCIVKIKICPIG